MKKTVIWILVMCFLLLYACSKNKDEQIAPQIKFEQPANFPSPFYQFEGNPLTLKGFELGKKLFYDVRLSADKSVSCGSCHQQFAAFAHLDHNVSHGVNNCLGKRNAPVLFNLAWQKEFFWDGGAKNLEISPLNAISDPCEMATDVNTIVAFLNQTQPYPQMFKTAFGNATANSQNMLRALAQFMATMVSANSKYDKVMRNPAQNSFTTDELAGYELFKKNCSGCHSEPLFTDLSYRNTGLDLVSIDEGRKHITEQQNDLGKFRVPTLRNIELSGPYMHDGRFTSLAQVLEHYNSGVKPASNLDGMLQQDGKLGIALSPTQKQQIISFLKTLTDDEFINNKQFSEY